VRENTREKRFQPEGFGSGMMSLKNLTAYCDPTASACVLKLQRPPMAAAGNAHTWVGKNDQESGDWRANMRRVL